MRIKGVVVEKSGSRLIIECDPGKHWKLQSKRTYDILYDKDSKPPEPFNPGEMPEEKTIVRLIWR